MRRRSFLAASTAGLIPLSGCLFLLDGDGGDGGGGGGGSNAESEPTPTPEPTSQYQGPTDEDPEFVDVQYRDFTENEVSDIKANAETVPYDDLLRDVESYQGQAVQYGGVVVQTIESDSHFTFLIGLNNSQEQLVYASWTGDRYIRGDVVGFYAEVIGPETYQTGAGGQLTVPALAIADIELLEETPTTTE